MIGSWMPLSEEEQRLLDEMERNLYKKEADTVSVSAGPRTVDYTRVAIGLLLAVAGLGIIIAGVAMKLIFIGVIGFAGSVAGILVMMSASKPADAARKDSGKPKQQGDKPSFMDKMSQEWDKRQER